MSQLYHESEHQELFFLDTPLRHPLPLHVPSALGPIGYYLCLRVPRQFADRLESVEATAQLTGLRGTDVRVAAGEGLENAPADRFESADPDLIWRLICRMPLSRGDGELTLHNLPDGLERADLLLCTWPRFIHSGQADQWIAGQEDPAWCPGGVAVGGIGVGKVELGRDGRFRNFSGNNNQDMPLEPPDGLSGAYLAFAVAEDELRAMASRPIDGLEPVQELSINETEPTGVMFGGSSLDESVQVYASISSLWTPHDVVHASLPVAIVDWLIPAAADGQPRRVRCRWAWPNLVGTGGGIGRAEQNIGYGDGTYVYWSAPDQPRQEPVDLGSVCGVTYTNAPNPHSNAADGKHFLLALKADIEGNPLEITTHDTQQGAAVDIVLEAGAEARHARMMLVWAMPHFVDNLGEDRGVYWLNRFPDAEAMIQHVAELLQSETPPLEGVELQELVESLPDWLYRRLLFCNYPLVTNSVLYRDGRFSINEGPTEMSGCYGTIDQRLGAHPATQLFFPELNRKELELFAAVQDEDGRINHDLGHGNLEKGPKGQNWPDIVCSFTLQCARHAWSTGEGDFEQAIWPHVRKAIFRHGQWADEGGGVPQLGRDTKLGTSYDSYHYEGTTAYMATLWLATLNVAELWGERVNDAELLEHVPRWRQAAIDRMEADLWNGRFYRAFHNRHNGETNENSHAGMLAGQLFSRMLTGRDVLPPERLVSCAEALVELQGAERFVIPPDEVSPDGTQGSLYGWLPYIEAFCLAPVASVLGAEPILPIWQRMIQTMNGYHPVADQHPCDTRLMYRPHTGEPSWGAYYMTAPASWLVVDALLDFFYRPQEQVLRLNPGVVDAMPVIHPLFWGRVHVEEETVNLEITRIFAAEPRINALEVPTPAKQVILADQPLTPDVTFGNYTRYRLPQPLLLQEGLKCHWRVEG